MSLHPVSTGGWQKALDFYSDRPIVVEPSAAKLTSDAGLLPLRQFDQKIGLLQCLSDAIEPCDDRQPERLSHSIQDLLRQRLFGIVAGWLSSLLRSTRTGSTSRR